MARRKSKSKKTSRTRRRRSVRGVNMNDVLMSFGGVVAGVAAAGYLNKLALQKQSSTIQTVAPIALGIIIPMVVKNDLGKYAGLGMFAYGGIKFLQKAGLGEIAGLGDEGETITISGDELSTLAGDDLSTLAGDDIFAVAGGDDYFAMAGAEEEEFGD